MNIAITALVLFGVFAILLILGCPISVSIAISSIATTLVNLPWDQTSFIVMQKMNSGVESFSLLAVPLFILAGNIMNNGGIARRLIRFAQLLSGRIPGSLAHTNVLANMFFGALSGSAVAAASAIGGIMAPMEEEEGYDPAFSTCVNIASAPTGLLIPPTSAFIVYSTVAGGVSVSALFMAGYIPGILMGLSTMAIAYCYAKKHNYCLILSLFYRSLTWKSFMQILLNSAATSGIILFLISASSAMSWVMAYTGIPAAISNAIMSLSTNKYVILLLMNLVLLVVGMFLDITPACLIFTPIFLPIVQSLGMDLVQFGVVLTFNMCMGTMTPPVGSVLFVSCGISKVPIERVVKPLLPYVGALLIVLFLVTYVPAISLTLPRLMGLV